MPTAMPEEPLKSRLGSVPATPGFKGEAVLVAAESNRVLCRDRASISVAERQASLECSASRQPGRRRQTRSCHGLSTIVGIEKSCAQMRTSAVVDRRVAWGYCCPYLSDDLRALGVGAGRARAQPRSCEEQAPMPGFSAVPHVGPARAERSQTSRSRDTQCASPPRVREVLVASADHVQAQSIASATYTSRLATAIALSR